MIVAIFRPFLSTNCSRSSNYQLGLFMSWRRRTSVSCYLYTFDFTGDAGGYVVGCLGLGCTFIGSRFGLAVFLSSGSLKDGSSEGFWRAFSAITSDSGFRGVFFWISWRTEASTAFSGGVSTFRWGGLWWTANELVVRFAFLSNFGVYCWISSSLRPTGSSCISINCWAGCPVVFCWLLEDCSVTLGFCSITSSKTGLLFVCSV